MLVDLLSPSNYLMVNKDAVKILGLNTAVYCSELLTIYKKVVVKNKFLNDEKYFKVDRKYITDQTSLSVEDQLKCDINLAKVNIIKIDENDPTVIYFDVEIFSSVLASEDIKLLDTVAKTVNVNNVKGVKKANQEYIIQSLKDSIRCKTPEVYYGMKDWIDTIFANGKKLSKAQVTLFKDKLDDYCNGDLDLALKIINAAITHAYLDCQWAINTVEKDKQVKTAIESTKTRTTVQKQTLFNGLSTEVF